MPMSTRSSGHVDSDDDEIHPASHPSTHSAASAREIAELRAQMSALTTLVTKFAQTAMDTRSEATAATPQGTPDRSHRSDTSAASYSRLAAGIKDFPADPRTDLAAIYWIQATERSLHASNIPKLQQLKIAASHILATAVATSTVDKCESFDHLKATLHAVFCPNTAITSHMLDVIKRDYDTPLEAFNAVYNLLSLIEYLQVPHAEIGPFFQRFLVMSVMNQELLDELERHVDIINDFEDDDSHASFRDQIIRKGSKPTPAPMLARRSGPSEGMLNALSAPPNTNLAQAQETIAHLEAMLNEAQFERAALIHEGKAYDLNYMDTSDQNFHDHESWALNYISASPADKQKLKAAMLKIPRHLRKQMYDAKQCYFCKKSIHGPGGHMWKDCPQAPA